MKFGNLNLLEPSGPHRACYGTPLPLLMPWIFFSTISIPRSSRPPDGLLYIVPYLFFCTSYIILYYFTLLSMSLIIYTTIPNVVCIPHAVQSYGILVTCFDPNKSSDGHNTCTWPYKSTMYLQCSTVQFKTICIGWKINYNSDIKWAKIKLNWNIFNNVNWLRHVRRMNSNRVPKIMLNCK